MARRTRSLSPERRRKNAFIPKEPVSKEPVSKELVSRTANFAKLFKPDGSARGRTEKLMFLYSEWVIHLQREGRKITIAGIGATSKPINKHVVQGMQAYVSSLGADPSAYGEPTGDFKTRVMIANAFTNWYQKPIKHILDTEQKKFNIGAHVKIEADDVIFTVGGCHAIKLICDAINATHSNGRIIVPTPHYMLYAGPQVNNDLYPIDLLKEPGYRLSAKTLDKSIQKATLEARVDSKEISAIILCEPSNPFGTCLPLEETYAIASVLRKYPNLKIVLDEAYIEMSDAISILTVAPDLKNRMTIIRSGTKSMSASGERLAVIITGDNEIKPVIVEYVVSSSLHTPRISQKAYAYAMTNTSEKEWDELKKYYGDKVAYVKNRLYNMKAAMPDPEYNKSKTRGAYYVLADFSDMLESKFPAKARQVLRNKPDDEIKTDEELCYALLFENDIMLAPLSYFGDTSKISGDISKKGYMRITCCLPEADLKVMMDKLEIRLLNSRMKGPDDK